MREDLLSEIGPLFDFLSYILIISTDTDTIVFRNIVADDVLYFAIDIGTVLCIFQYFLHSPYQIREAGLRDVAKFKPVILLATLTGAMDPIDSCLFHFLSSKPRMRHDEEMGNNLLCVSLMTVIFVITYSGNTMYKTLLVCMCARVIRFSSIF